VVTTAVTIRESGVDRAVELAQQGVGPDRLLMMVSTEEEHHFANSGCTLPEYWRECERSIRKAHDAGMTMCGTVSTIWGSPIGGATKLEDALDFTRRWLAIGADDIEHADHDGSASAPEVYRYFAMTLDALPDTALRRPLPRDEAVASASARCSPGRHHSVRATLAGSAASRQLPRRLPVPGTATAASGTAPWGWSAWKTCSSWWMRWALPTADVDRISSSAASWTRPLASAPGPRRRSTGAR
jgi:hydroxymethylglutaryl-CoA lyase